MIIMYPLDWPFSVQGVVFYDSDADVYVATSSNLRGLVVEAESLEALEKEVENCTLDLLELNYDYTMNKTRKGKE